MKTITEDVYASIEFRFSWSSSAAFHQDCCYMGKINFWRDRLPPKLHAALMGKKRGDTVKVSFEPDEILPSYEKSRIYTIGHSQIDYNFFETFQTRLMVGRFYPKGILKGIPGIFRENMEPFRCIAIDQNGITADFNHPLANKAIVIEAIVHDVRDKPGERGGSCLALEDIIGSSPGMQARFEDHPTDFFAADPFKRENEISDQKFYSKPRLVTHIDDTAIHAISDLYGRFIKNGMAVLDLMSSWKSHIPENIELRVLTGLGLNTEELENNDQLTDYVIHDLNGDPSLPFDDNTYDAVICTVSVEYLTQPFEVFKEVARILKADGYFILTFSNRWFPPKVTKIWKEIHEFERIGLVLEYFLKTERFKNLETYSMHGLPRPENDKYASEILYSDPVFAVWGQKQ